MDSNLIIVNAAKSRNLTTRSRVKEELGIADNSTDSILDGKIAEASSDIELALGFAVPSEDVTETFRHDHPVRYAYGYGWRMDGHHWESLILRRKAVSAVSSVTLDDVVLDPSEYYLNADQGSLHRLDTSGFPCEWWFCKSLIVAHTAGYILPGSSGSNLPPTIEGIAIELVKSFWFSRKRDPSVNDVNIPGVMQTHYWVGATGDPESLPPEIQRRIALVRRPRLAVA